MLDRMQVQYRETKVGFECIHAPSIDLTTVQSGQLLSNSRRSHQFGLSAHAGGMTEGGAIRRSLTKKASKLSFALKGKEKERDVTSSPTPAQDLRAEKDNATVNSAATDMSKSNSSSIYNVSSNAHTIKADNSAASANGTASGTGAPPPPSEKDKENATISRSPSKTKNLPPIPRDFVPQQQQQRATSPVPPTSYPSGSFPTGEVDQDVFDAMGASRLSVRFEINIVKVSNCIFAA